MIKLGQATSSLILYDILVSSVEFKMSEGYKSLDEDSLSFNFDFDIYESSDRSIHKIETTTIINNGDNKDLYIKLIMSGYFGFQQGSDLDEDMKEHFIEKNTLAIIFPFIRSYVTNLTAQSGGKPIIIPPININALIEDDDE